LQIEMPNEGSVIGGSRDPRGPGGDADSVAKGNLQLSIANCQLSI
jgi:hypothetical protein